MYDLFTIFEYEKRNIHEMNSFAKVSKNLVKYKFENNFVMWTIITICILKKNYFWKNGI